MNTIHSIPLAGLLAVVPAAAQGLTTVESFGPFAGASTSMSVADGDASGLDCEELLLRRDGFHQIPPGLWQNSFSGANRPDYSKAAVLYDPNRPGGTPSAPVDIDAMSGGFDVLLMGPGGVVQASGPNWGSLIFSVRRGVTGRPTPNGNVFATEEANAGGAGADIFSYVFQGPGVPLPPEMVGVTMRSNDSTETGLAFTPTDDSEIDALDVNIPSLRLDPTIVNLFPAGPRRFYFSVTSATASNIPAAWWGGETPSGATILRTQWNTTQMAWTTPSVFVTHTVLGLDVDDELTALCVDEGKGFLVFSSDAVGQDPLMFLNYGALGISFTGGGGGSIATEVKYPNGDKVSEDIGLLDVDIVDAICSLDPGPIDGGNPGRHTLRFAIPTWSPPPPILPYTVNCSGFRSVQGTQPVFRTYAIGWPESGTGGFAVFQLLPFPGASAGFVRDPSNPFDGDPTEFVLNLPTGPLGLQVPCQWFAARPPFIFGGVPNDFAGSYPLVMTLP